MVHAAKRNSARCPTHPGALLREDVIPAIGRAKAEIAQLLGISRQHLYDILRERKLVSPAIAVRLGKLFPANRRSRCGDSARPRSSSRKNWQTCRLSPS
jgi:addiction module HigA family antidote